MDDRAKNTEIIKAEALRLGFSACGISLAEKLDKEAQHLSDWLQEGKNADMDYMQNNFDKRINPKELVPNSKTVISVILNYFPGEIPHQKGKARISKYALGRDYHKVMKKKLKQLFQFINDEIQPIQGRFFTDSAPVMDKAWAEKSGLGWRGKNGNLINKTIGSFFFIGEIIIDLDLIPDKAINAYCGNCTDCIDACPTDALHIPYKLDANLCISYHTIENKDLIPENIIKNIEDNIFGCDICQDVCPWNQKIPLTQIKDFGSRLDLLKLEYNDYLNMDEDSFNKIFEGTPVRRAGYHKIKQSVQQIISYQNESIS